MVKKLLSLLLAVAVAASAMAYDFTAAASSGQTLYFTVTGADSVAVVSPAGSGWSGYTAPTGWLAIPATVSHGGTTYSVTSVGSMAFRMCDGLTGVSIPGSVESIGMRSFFGDEALRRVVVGEGVRHIDQLAFCGCTALDTIELPSTLMRIATSAFENTGYYNNTANWSSDYALLLGQWVIKVGNRVEGVVTVPYGIVGIANSAFLYCRNMRRVNLPATLLYVGEGAFKDCEVLDTVRLYATVPPSLYDDSFDGVDMPATLIVPCSKRTVYEAADYWNAFDVKDTCGRRPNPVPVVGIDDVDAAPQPVVSTTADGLLVRGAEGLPLTLSDMMGRTVCSVRCATAEQRLPLPAAGIYVLRAGGQAFKISYCCR